MSKKRVLGQFFTEGNDWLQPHIREFIMNSGCTAAYDPFAGSGDLLRLAGPLGFPKTFGLDIDESLGYPANDSLIYIPPIENAIIITNPPYLTKYSAKRRHIIDGAQKYFDATRYDDLYLLALEKMIEAQKYIVAIVPETFINSRFEKNRLHSITILEGNCFDDTQAPVCVLCFDGVEKGLENIRVYKNEKYLNRLKYFEDCRMKPSYSVDITFNTLEGRVALRAVDTTNPACRIAFMRKEELGYDLAGIKHSSRLITLIRVGGLPEHLEEPFIAECNHLVENLRRKTQDVVLSPFKGNMKDGVRRRRLDYETARAIMEEAYHETIPH